MGLATVNLRYQRQPFQLSRRVGDGSGGVERGTELWSIGSEGVKGLKIRTGRQVAILQQPLLSFLRYPRYLAAAWTRLVIQHFAIRAPGMDKPYIETDSARRFRRFSFRDRSRVVFAIHAMHPGLS